MDDRRFDDLAKRIGDSRRSFLKKAIGLGGAAAAARLGVSEAEAARRGYSGPSGGPKPNEPVTERFCDGDCCWTCTESAQILLDSDKATIAACHFLFPQEACGYCVDKMRRGDRCRVS